MSLPSMIGFKVAAIAASTSLIVGFGAGWTVHGWKIKADALKAARAETKAAVKVIETIKKADAITLDVGEKAAKTVEVVRWRTRTIVQEIPKYVTLDADRACTVPVGFVRLHDAAATGKALSDAPGQSDDAASGVALSAVAGTVAQNYGLYHETAERLRALQDWVRQQQGVQ